MEFLECLVVVHTLDNLWTHKTASCDDTFQTNHPVEQVASQCSRVATILAEAANICNVIHRLLVLFECSSMWKCINDLFQRSVKAWRIFEGVKEDAIRQFSRVGPNIIQRYVQSTLMSVQHGNNVSTIRSSARIGRVKEFRSETNTVSDRLVTQLCAVERHCVRFSIQLRETERRLEMKWTVDN